MAVQLAELRRSGWPGPREGLWVAELDGRVVGAVTLRDLGGGLAALGHLALAAGGARDGRRPSAHRTPCSWPRASGRTTSGSSSSPSATSPRRAGLYRRAGFELTSSEHVVRWGIAIDWERWELAL